MGGTVAESRVVEMVLNNPALAILGAVILGLAVWEIFDKKSAQTADRPTWIMSSTILNNDFNVLFLKASDPTWKIPDTDDAVIPFIMEAETQIINTFPGMNVIDLMPSLGKLPMFLKPWERKGRARYRRDLAWAMKRLEAAQDRLAKGDPSLENTFWGSVLKSDDLRGMSCKEEVAILGLSLIVGAADTSIPYLRMMMKELWRWRPPVALGHPHITARDLQVGEYCLPKGARLHVNAYAISHDPARHEDPERFWPERFKDDETTTMESMNHQDPTKRDHFAFGAGRRGCPGYHVAERSFVITMMRILWAFDIAPAPGTKSTLEFADYAGELPGNPAEDMPVKLTYRSESRKKIVMDFFERETAARPAMMPLNMGEKSIPKPEEYL
ncbi:Cytochrome P450 monooxygenase yanC [Colletotrichum sp. SAR 10_76]|nr:Cytochrome P450 monooxygenase yanC [Colletotrichum sp. SAR 10_76]